MVKIKKPMVMLPSIRWAFLLASMLLMFLILSTPRRITAQESGFGAPYYLVEEGDSLWGIAVRFGVSLEELQTLNNINDPNQLAIGMRLFLPGLAGISGQIDSRQVNYGDTLQSLSRRYQLSENAFAQLNRITSPTEVIAGSFIIVPIETENEIPYQHIIFAPGQSLLELALQSGENPWVLLMDNNLRGSWAALPGSPLQLRASETRIDEPIPNGLPLIFEQIEVNPLPTAQGKTLVIKMKAPSAIEMSGSFAGQELKFFTQDDGYVALQGIHTLIEPGPYPLALEGQLAGGTAFAFSQAVLVRSTEYIYDPVLIVDPKTIDPAVTEPENEIWASLGIPATPEKMWDGLFTSPVPSELTGCWTSFFGNRRAYNGSAYDFFHSGLDFCGRVGTELYAPAAGKVVYTGSLVVRGHVVVIDHGWGVYSAYDHLSEVLVQPGDFVQPGQTIGLGGETGRTTGPHLHWEVWVGGVQVDPADWLEQTYP